MIWPDPHSPSFTQKVIYLFMDVPEVPQYQLEPNPLRKIATEVLHTDEGI